MKISNQSNVTYNAAEPNNPAVPGSAASNTVITEVLSDAIKKVMTVDKTYAKEGETVHNTVTINNNSSAVLTPAFIINPAPDGASFVDGSVKINGVAVPADPVSGITLPVLNAGESITVEYDMKINSPSTVNTVTNSAEFRYDVGDPVSGIIRTYTEPVNAVTVNVVNAKLEVVKSVDKAFAVKGETLTYTVTFTNKGNTNINDINFTDNIPQGTTFVEGSVFINEQNISSYRPDTGYRVASLAPDGSATTSFKVTID